MRHPILLSVCLGSAVLLSACDRGSDQDVERALADINVIDESNLNEVMLTVGDPNEAVAYFQRASNANPDRIDLKRQLAQALIRAQQPDEAADVLTEVVAMSGATAEDRVGLADALIRAGDWDAAETQLDQVPPTHETFQRYRLEAMIADANEEWDRADSYYETAVDLTTRPAGVYNNWGYSKLTRGQYAEAEDLFAEALKYSPDMFTAKNNLVMARGAQRKYDLPVVKMTQVERAQLMHTLALTAIRQGDVNMGKTLLEEAIETHPQHFEAAVLALQALDNGAS